MKVSVFDLAKRFGENVAVDRVTLAVEDGECFFLLGPSGCGKTTLLRIVAGFCEPDSGDVFFDDRVVTDTPPHRRNTGMVFQNYALWPHMTVARNVAFGLTVPGRKPPRAERDERVGQALEAVRISHLAGKRPNQLSGGEQQRVALARALVIKPDCLLLDEPLSNLDAKLRLELRAEIRRVVKELGVTTIYVTHDQKEALSMADRCAVMRAGRIEQVGSPRELYNRPANRFVADFVGETNLVDGMVLAIDGNTAAVHAGFAELVAGVVIGRAAAGETVTLSIRPEAIRAGAAPAGGSNAFSASVAEVTYFGETAQYWISTLSGSRLKVLEANPRHGLQPGPQTLPFWIAPEDVVLLENVGRGLGKKSVARLPAPSPVEG